MGNLALWNCCGIASLWGEQRTNFWRAFPPKRHPEPDRALHRDPAGGMGHAIACRTHPDWQRTGCAERDYDASLAGDDRSDAVRAIGATSRQIALVFLWEQAIIY